jgi:hypothetical protein
LKEKSDLGKQCGEPPISYYAIADENCSQMEAIAKIMHSDESPEDIAKHVRGDASGLDFGLRC